VAAETGIVGFAAFMFLVVRAGLGARTIRQLLKRPKKGRPDPLQSVLTDSDRKAMQAYTVALTAGFLGWFVCSLFASVAYNWTFYYLLALIAASREMVMARVRAARGLEATSRKVVSVPAHVVSRKVATWSV